MTCPKCSADNPEHAKFCASCGFSLSGEGSKPTSRSLPGSFHRFCLALIAIWTAMWAGSFATVGAPTPPTGVAATLGWTLGAGLVAGAWGFVVVVLAILAIATKPSPSVPWPRSTKLTTGILSALVFFMPILLTHPVSSSPPSSPIASSTPSNNKPTDQWQVSEGSSPMDGSPTVVLSLPSQGNIQGWLESEHPDLIIRCQENKAEIYVVTGTSASVEYGSDAHTVRLRFDEEKPITQHWSASTDGKALFAPNAINLAKQLNNHSKFTFQFTPFQANPAIAVFELDGIDKHIGEVKKACGWH